MGACSGEESDFCEWHNILHGKNAEFEVRDIVYNAGVYEKNYTAKEFRFGTGRAGYNTAWEAWNRVVDGDDADIDIEASRVYGNDQREWLDDPEDDDEVTHLRWRKVIAVSAGVWQPSSQVIKIVCDDGADAQAEIRDYTDGDETGKEFRFGEGDPVVWQDWQRIRYGQEGENGEGGGGGGTNVTTGQWSNSGWSGTYADYGGVVTFAGRRLVSGQDQQVASTLSLPRFPSGRSLSRIAGTVSGYNPSGSGFQLAAGGVIASVNNMVLSFNKMSTTTYFNQMRVSVSPVIRHTKLIRIT